MNAATQPRSERDASRLLVLDAETGEVRDSQIAELAAHLCAGDLLVLNDAATLPGSLPARTARGESIELRLTGPAREDEFEVVVFGAGDYHVRTEDRSPPPALERADVLELGARGRAMQAVVTDISPVSRRLVRVRFDRTGSALWSSLYAMGAPVQYAYQTVDLPLWSVQTAYAARPWAAEMPSAGRPLTFGILQSLRRAGVELATLTHAAGLSATGDPQLDAALPLPERYEIPVATADAIERTRARGGRVIAVGTTVVRALEGAAATSGRLEAVSGITDLRVGPNTPLRIVSGILTGMHSPAESHYQLLAAFVPEPLLRAAFAHAEQAGYLAHEFGDSTLILPRSARTRRRAA